MKQSQSSSFILAQSRIFQFQDLNLSDFSADQRKPIYVRQFRVDEQYNQKQFENRQYLEKCKEILKNKKIKHQNEKFIGIEEYKKVQKQKRISISKEIYGKFVQQKQSEFLKLLSFCLAILFILVLIFHQNEPVQIQGLF